MTEPYPEPIAVHAALRSQAATALATNRTQSAQNAAIVVKADAMLAFAGASLTNPQLISALKDLAAGVKAMAVHDEANKAQINALIRLVVGQLDGTD